MTAPSCNFRRVFAVLCFSFAVVFAGCSRRTAPPAPAGGNPAPQPAVQAPPVGGSAAPAQPDSYADLYGDQGGEEVLPADKAPQGALLRARKGDTFFKLSNPRIEPTGRKPFPQLVVEYERVHDGPYGGQSLHIRAADGRDRTILMIGPFSDRAGKLEIDLGIPRPGSPGHPKDAELYFTRQEGRYGGNFHPTFKVSNSVVMGSTKFPPTLSRNWTPDEAAKLRQPPPEGPKANVNAHVGEDTEFVGDATAGSFRYAEPGKPLIGVDYRPGEWDKEPCLARLTPVYEEKQLIEPVSQRLLAKPGYAVGGLVVRSKRYVNAVQVIFMKRTPDGKLDPKDSYTSNWLGHENVGMKEVKLGGDGRLVIGLNCKQGAILNAVALVMERPGGK